jgi:hypothetical protein
MARKAPVSYDNLILGSQEANAEPSAKPEMGRQEPASELLRDIAQQYVVYLHPAAHKTIARYALEQSGHRNKVRPHDIIISAIEDFFEKHGLQGPVRAKPAARK